LGIRLIKQRDQNPQKQNPFTWRLSDLERILTLATTVGSKTSYTNAVTNISWLGEDAAHTARDKQHPQHTILAPNIKCGTLSIHIIV
jgi:hypothetical protein